MKELTNEEIKVINKFWDSNDATFVEDNDKFFDRETCNKKDYDEVESIFWKYLITGQHWSATNKKIMSDNGFVCWAGDQDSYGLLVACVTKNGKTFSFG